MTLPPKTKFPGARSKKLDHLKRYCDVGNQISWEDNFEGFLTGTVTKVYANQYRRVSYYVGTRLVFTEDLREVPEPKPAQTGAA